MEFQEELHENFQEILTPEEFHGRIPGRMFAFNDGSSPKARKKFFVKFLGYFLDKLVGGFSEKLPEEYLAEFVKIPGK